MLTELIPDDVVIPGLILSDQAAVLCRELAASITAPDLAPMDVGLFLDRLLRIESQDGTPTGLALRAPASHPSPRRGQQHTVPPHAWQARQALGEPLVCALARRIVRTAAEQQPDHAPELPFALDLLDQVGPALERLATQGQWASTLLTHPKSTANRIFDLHYHTAGYPAWDSLAYRLQAGLAAQIAKEANKPQRKRDHNIRTYCTAPKALVPLIRLDLLLPGLAAFDEDDTLLRDALWQAVTQLQGIDHEAHRDYVVKLLDMLGRGAAARPSTTGRSGFARRRRHPFQLAELNPEANPTRVPGVEARQRLAEHAAMEQDEPPPAPLDAEQDAEYDQATMTPAMTPAMEAAMETATRPAMTPAIETAMTAAIHPTWHAGNRITLDRNSGPDQPNVFQLRELAEMYAALSRETPAPRSLDSRLSHAARFLMLDLLIHTGRPPGWLAAIRLASPPAPDEVPPAPLYDPDRGAICYAPHCYIGIPPRFLPEATPLAQEDDQPDRPVQDTRAKSDPTPNQQERHEHAQACQPVQLWHYLPLTPRQVSLVSAYLTLRTQAIASLPIAEGIPTNLAKVALFLLAHDGHLRPWAEADTQQLCRDLNNALHRRHPGYPPVHPSRFRASFSAWYCHYGLDPVYALWISEHYRNEFQMPAIYSRVHVEAQAHAYAEAQARLCADIVAEYLALPGAPAPGDRDPLLWQPDDAPTLTPWKDESFGSWHCPLPKRLRILFAGLRDMAVSNDPTIAQRGRAGLIAAGLTVMAGLRPAEVCTLGVRAHWVDLDDGTIATHGKDNFALTTNRQVIVPPALRPLLQQALASSLGGPLPHDGRGHYALWVMKEQTPAFLTESEGNAILVEAGQRAGLRQVQIPDWYALRHFYRSHALEAGVPFHVTNALMGHQVLGCDLYNRALDQSLEAVLAQGLALAERIAQELGWSEAE
jgi:hypothetical protein